MGDSGLSQDDFRKLLQTPRPGSNDDPETTTAQTPRFKAPAPKAPRNTGAVFATPQAIRKKKSQKPSSTPSNYRDRAAERRNNEQQDELSTEELLQKTTREQDETLDAKQLYEQSKYLGGDVDHTHLVKGLDYSLLEKVRNDIGTKLADAKSEAVLDSALDRLGQEKGTTRIIDQDEDEDENDEDEEVERIAVRSILAKNLVHLITTPKPTSNELFTPGRMAFVFELADEVGHYTDAFALPTTVIRSKADVIRKRTDMQQETELVINKISQIMRPQQQQPEIKKEDKKKKKQNSESIVAPSPLPPVDSDDDIFSDAGTDYELDEETLTKDRNDDNDEVEENSTVRKNYFGKEEEQEEKEGDQMQEVSKLLSQATQQNKLQQSVPSQQQEQEQEQPAKRRKFEQEQEDADAMDIDMYGLGTAALPTSFEDRQRTIAYDSDDDDEDDGGSRATTSLVDQGTNRNKKAQLTRWDFDDEEQWQKYKDTIEIHPKSAFQYGVKLGDGRKRNREQRRGMSDKQKLNRDYQMVKNIMDKKYGK